ncbi:MAG TPA: ATP-binding protein [Hyphomonadaceae bacterium]|nr:ATP-binding protein [Hyphomonadaceae bacterium]
MVVQVTSAKPEAPWLEQLRHEQVASLYSTGFMTMAVTWIAAAVLGALLVYIEQGSNAVAVLVWFALVSLQAIARMVMTHVYRARPREPSEWKVWADWFTWGAIVGGVVWGIGTIFLMPPDRFDLQMLIVVTLSALVYGAVASMGLWLPAFYGFCLTTMVPVSVWSLFQPTAEHIAYGLLAAIWIPAVCVLAHRFNRSSVKALRVGYENAALAKDLNAQKAAAEEANAAKSRFLASASHDLRQPVHALGLFAGALKHEKLPARAADIAERIDGAVETLDKLFVALLDVSKLDAGVVQAEPRALDAGAMLARLGEEMRPTAEEKGLVLEIHAPTAWVRSDPILLERIVRNLMSNAVRYTRAGRVLAAVRVAGRKRASIEVWDTGPGIPESQRLMIFEEFYRAEPKDRRSEGLGLGLAIVKRLCNLMDHPIELKSITGSGSLFRISVPVAQVPALSAPMAAPDIVMDGGARIWVIDDDPTILSAMEAILGAWGHDVVATASGEEMIEAFARDPRAPNAILCDWQLGAENGIHVLQELRAKIGHAAPSALITGETDPEKLREAQGSGFPILHKPLGKAQLRALVGNLVRKGLAPA